MDQITYKVLDASVILKWFIQEENSNEALVYLEDFSQGKFTIIIPNLLFYELGNALLYNKAEVQHVSEIMTRLQALSLKTIDIGFDSFRKVFQNAKEHNISFYDASYITLMQTKDCEFVTADAKLYQKIKKQFSRTKLL